jgi:hypothetical protein
MEKKYYDFHFDLSVDGVHYPSAAVSPLFQTDPWPGGHRYSCVVSGPRLGKYFDYLPIGRSAPVSNENASRFFTSLGLQWDDNGVRPSYFLNSVDELDFDGQRIVFAGVCSPVVGVNGDA